MKISTETRDCARGAFWAFVWALALSLGWHVGLPEMWRAVFR